MRKMLSELKHVYGGRVAPVRCLIVSPANVRPTELIEAAIEGGCPRESVEHTRELTQTHLDELVDAELVNNVLHCQV